jgi:hypothetical protein
MPTAIELRIGLAAIGLVIFAIANPAQASVITATFDDLPTSPAQDSATGLQFANNNSLDYNGVLWDSGFSVVGDQYQVSPPSGPDYGIPHSGHYFVTNENGGSVTLTTNLLLTGAWFGQNEYYGFGGGANQVTIVALSGSTDLASVVFDLAENHPGQPEPLAFVDTSAFAALSGITGYRIDLHGPNQYAVNWVADDFQFTQAASVPSPGTLALLAAALPGWMGLRRRQGRKPRTVGLPGRSV